MVDGFTVREEMEGGVDVCPAVRSYGHESRIVAVFLAGAEGMHEKGVSPGMFARRG